jgi:YhcH/YjgK/YiaL family protein
MIIDHISNCKRYVNLHPGFAEAFKFLSKLKDDFRGGFMLKDKALFGSVNDVTGHDKEKAKFECHTKYIDIQYIVEGADCIGWANTSPNDPGTEYNEENDYRFVTIQPTSWIDVPKGHFVIFFPEDAHAPLCINEKLTKVFMKVKLNY